MNYNDVLNLLVKLAGTEVTDSDFLKLLPNVFDYAEQRMYRELDLLATVTRDSSKTLTLNVNAFALPTSPHFVTAQQFNVITPASMTDPLLGARNTLVQVSREFLDAVWNSMAGAAVPQYYAPLTDQQILVGPWPDATYTVEVIGTIRPTPLSKDNPTTFLSLYLPDLFVAACMIFIMGAQRNFGAQSDDPRSAVSWEDQYEKLFNSAGAEELRKKWTDMNWQSMGKAG